MSFRCREISPSLIGAIFVVTILNTLKMFKQFGKIDAASVLRQFTGITEKQKNISIIKNIIKMSIIVPILTDCVGMPANVEYIVIDFEAR